MIPTIDASAKCLCTHYNASHKDGKCLLCDGCTGFKTFTQVLDRSMEKVLDSHRQALRQKFPAAQQPHENDAFLKRVADGADPKAEPMAFIPQPPCKMVRTTAPPGVKVGDAIYGLPGFIRCGIVTNITQTADGKGEAEVVEKPVPWLDQAPSLEALGYEASIGHVGDKLTHVSLSKRDPNQPPLHGQKDEFVKPPILPVLREIYLRALLKKMDPHPYSIVGIDMGSEPSRTVIVEHKATKACSCSPAGECKNCRSLFIKPRGKNNIVLRELSVFMEHWKSDTIGDETMADAVKKAAKAL